MAKRKSTGKRARFEVFKRDGFKCCYCGRSPPDVLLHADHIIAVSNGGTDDPTNLITACADCNLGKADVPLTSVVPLMERQAEEAQERAEQVRAYAEAMIEARGAQDETIEALGEAWFRGLPSAGEGRRWALNTADRDSIRRFLGLMSVPDLLEAIDITHRAISRGRIGMPRVGPEGLHTGYAFRYFCGVCWKTIKAKGEAQ